jgi:hypothetical protein
MAAAPGGGFFHGGTARFVIVIACNMRMFVVELVPAHDLYAELYEKNRPPFFNPQ